MTRAKKEGTYLNVKLRQDIYDRFSEYADKKGQTKTTALERILERVLDEEEQSEDKR